MPRGIHCKISFLYPFFLYPFFLVFYLYFFSISFPHLSFQHLFCIYMCNLYFIDGFYIFHVPLICLSARHVSILQIRNSGVLACFPKIKHTSPYAAIIFAFYDKKQRLLCFGQCVNSVQNVGKIIVLLVWRDLAGLAQ